MKKIKSDAEQIKKISLAIVNLNTAFQAAVDCMPAHDELCGVAAEVEIIKSAFGTIQIQIQAAAQAVEQAQTANSTWAVAAVVERELRADPDFRSAIGYNIGINGQNFMLTGGGQTLEPGRNPF